MLYAQHKEKGIFGGLANIKGKATGYFHVEKLQGRQMLVTPDGYGFFALGMNHINVLDSNDTLTDAAIFMKATTIAENLKRWNLNNCGYGVPTIYRIGCPIWYPYGFFRTGTICLQKTLVLPMSLMMVL